MGPDPRVEGCAEHGEQARPVEVDTGDREMNHVQTGLRRPSRPRTPQCTTAEQHHAVDPRSGLPNHQWYQPFMYWDPSRATRPQLPALACVEEEPRSMGPCQITRAVDPARSRASARRGNTGEERNNPGCQQGDIRLWPACPGRSESAFMYISGGTILVILVIVVIVLLLRRR